MNISAESLSDASRESDDAATEAARRINWMNTSAPRNQPRGSKPSTPGPVATSRSRSSGFKPAVASANAAMAGKEPRRFQVADSNNTAIQIVVDAANHAVTGWVRMTFKLHPIMMIATTNVTRLSQLADSSIRVAPAPPLYFDWRELEISSFCANNILRSPVFLTGRPCRRPFLAAASDCPRC